MAMDRLRHRTELLRDESARLLSYLETVPLEAMDQPSACERWQVSHVVTHLGSAVQSHCRAMSRGMEGLSDPPQQAAPPQPGISASEGIARNAIALRERLGGQMVSTLRDRYTELFELLEAISSADLAKPCWHPRGIILVGDYTDLLLQELAIHGWDACSNRDKDYHMGSAMAQEMVDVAQRWLELGFHTSTQRAQAVRYRFDLSDGPAVQQVVEDGVVRRESTDSGEADVTFRCSAETYVLLIYGRLTAGSLKPERLSSAGDAGLAAELWGSLGHR